jgi:hypothetical protein
MSALPLKADMFTVRNDVRLVPLADIEIMGAHVRLTPKSRHTQRQNRCPLSAKTCIILARLAVGTLL